jgi:hypothetical protein
MVMQTALMKRSLRMVMSLMFELDQVLRYLSYSLDRRELAALRARRRFTQALQ